MATATLTTPVTKIRGRIEAVYYAGARFSAGRLITPDGDAISFAGKLYAREQDQVILEGHWVTHPQYGQQLEVDSVVYDLELDGEGLAHYLAHHPDIKGIGPVKAKRIAERFSKDFGRAIVEEPEAVAEAAKLPLATVKRLREEWLKTRAVNQALTQLAAYGLTHHQVTSLVDRLGNDALGLLQADPYLIVREIRGFGFKRVDKIARRMGTAKDDPSRIRAGILHCVEAALDQGDCWVEFEELIERANALLVMDALDSRALIEQSLKSLIDGGALTCAAHSSRFLVARPDIRRMEEDLAATLAQGEAPNTHFPEAEELPDLIDELAPTLLPGQHEAVLTALSHTVTLISGGAGSGKSYTVAELTKIYEEEDHESSWPHPPARRPSGSRSSPDAGPAPSTGCSVSTASRSPADPTTPSVRTSSSSMNCRWSTFRWPGSCSDPSISSGPPWCWWAIITKGPLGTRALNIALQRLIQAKLWGVEAPIPKPGRRPQLLVHDKVIQTRNNYALGVMNGAVGAVTEVASDGSLRITFDGMPVNIKSGSPNKADIELAYALTIHKAQGSEFPCAVVVVHKSHSFMHHRNLFYTGVTRAKEAVVIVGDRWGIANCAKKRHLNARKTFLSLLLSSGGAL